MSVCHFYNVHTKYIYTYMFVEMNEQKFHTVVGFRANNNNKKYDEEIGGQITLCFVSKVFLILIEHRHLVS
jgi:hypothetical protein